MIEDFATVDGFILFIAGLAFGSFLNVCISRIPSDESVVAPPSRCPSCRTPIRWRDNIPVISWLLLRRRCRQCGTRISARYPAVELLTAALFIACYASFGWTLLTLKYCVFAFLLVGLIFMDAETGLLPREFTYPGIFLGLLFSCFAPTDYSGTAFLIHVYGKHVPKAVPWLALLDSALGCMVGAGFFYLAWALYYLVRKRHGVGFGDIALMAMSGAFLGLKLTLLVIFFSPILGALYAGFLLVTERLAGRFGAATRKAAAAPFLSREIPFGVFLGVSSLAVVFVGESVWKSYLGLY